MTPVPDAAVRIVEGGGVVRPLAARRVVAALDAAGWLHDPDERRAWHEAQIALAGRAARLEAEVAALRAVADAAQAADLAESVSDVYHYVRTDVHAALDALPPAGAP